MVNNIAKYSIVAFVSAAILLAFGAVASAYTAADFGSAVLKVGSKGTPVSNMQSALNMSSCGSAGLTADGSFGPRTRAAVVAFQGSSLGGASVKADGIVGNMTKAKLAACSAGGSTGNLPAGCTSTSGYSTVNGAPCNSGAGSTVPGCMPGYAFSPTTGASCTGTQGGPLQGGAGSLTVTELSSPSNSTKVGEGDDDVKVLGVEYEADNNSDLKIDSMKISLSQSNGSGSTKLTRYAKSVEIWQGSTQVGSADADEFSESSDTYSKSISLSNAIVKADTKENFYVVVNAVENIDSTDISNNTWTATLSSTRYVDATGAILTDSTGSISVTHQYVTLVTANDVELKVGLASDTPNSQTKKASTTSDTLGVELMKFTLKAQGGAMTVDAIPVYFTTNETDLDEVTANVTIKIDGQTFNEAVSTSTSASTTILFDDLDLALDANETLTGTVLADISDIETSTFDEGTTLSAQMRSAEVTTAAGTNGVDVEDANGDQLAASDRSGTAIGNTITFFSEGVNVTMGTPTYKETFDQNGAITQVEFKIPVKVASFGDTLYLGQSVQLASDATSSAAFALVFENSSAPTTAVTTSSGSFTISADSNGTQAQIETNGFRLNDGTTYDFVITATHVTPASAGSYRVRLDEIQTFTEAGLVTATDQDLEPQSSFRTDYKYIAS